jgi:hypothetical protein
MLEKKWGLFCKVMERCGKAVGPEIVEQYDAAMAAAGRAPATESAGTVEDGKEECWEHLAQGNAAMVTSVSSAMQESQGRTGSMLWTSRGIAGSGRSMVTARGWRGAAVLFCTARRAQESQSR